MYFRPGSCFDVLHLSDVSPKVRTRGEKESLLCSNTFGLSNCKIKRFLRINVLDYVRIEESVVDLMIILHDR